MFQPLCGLHLQTLTHLQSTLITIRFLAVRIGAYCGGPGGEDSAQGQNKKMFVFVPASAWSLRALLQASLQPQGYKRATPGNADFLGENSQLQQSWLSQLQKPLY